MVRQLRIYLDCRHSHGQGRSRLLVQTVAARIYGIGCIRAGMNVSRAGSLLLPTVHVTSMAAVLVEVRMMLLTWTTERPSNDGHYWMRWQGQTVGVFYVWRGRFYHGLTEQHPPTDVEWLEIQQPQ